MLFALDIIASCPSFKYWKINCALHLFSFWFNRFECYILSHIERFVRLFIGYRRSRKVECLEEEKKPKIEFLFLQKIMQYMHTNGVCDDLIFFDRPKFSSSSLVFSCVKLFPHDNDFSFFFSFSIVIATFFHFVFFSRLAR